MFSGWAPGGFCSIRCGHNTHALQDNLHTATSNRRQPPSFVTYLHLLSQVLANVRDRLVASQIQSPQLDFDTKQCLQNYRFLLFCCAAKNNKTKTVDCSWPNLILGNRWLTVDTLSCSRKGPTEMIFFVAKTVKTELTWRTRVGDLT